MEYSEEFGRQQIFDITGLPVHSVYTLPKIAWLKQNRPEVFAATDRFLCIEDYILTRVGVGSYISLSLASRMMGLNLAKRDWSEKLLSFAGINMQQLAKPVEAATPLGCGNRVVCEELNLPADVIWVTGGHDQACCSLGAGGIKEGIAVDGTGTFECISIPVSSSSREPKDLQYNFPTQCHAVPQLHLVLSYIAGGASLKWFRDVISRHFVQQAVTQGRDVYDLILSNLPNEPTNILVYPHVVGAGTPWLNAEARGAIIGFNAQTTYEELAKAVLEGITLEMGWNLQLQEKLGKRLGRIHAVGGGSRSTAWLQMKADIFNREVVTIPGEAGTMGAAICAGVGTGLYPSFSEAAAVFLRPGTIFCPRQKHTERYMEKLEIYQEKAGCLFGFSLSATSQ